MRPIMPGEQCIHYKTGDTYTVLSRSLSARNLKECEWWKNSTVTDDVKRGEQVVTYQRTDGLKFSRPARVFDSAGRFTLAEPEPDELTTLRAEVEEHRRRLYIARGEPETAEYAARDLLHTWLEDEAAALADLTGIRAQVAQARAAWQAAQVQP